MEKEVASEELKTLQNFLKQLHLQLGKMMLTNSILMQKIRKCIKVEFFTASYSFTVDEPPNVTKVC